MNQEEAVKILDLVVREHMLPATMDKLVPLSFIGAAAVKFYQAKVKLMSQLGITEAQRKATLSDGQNAGEMLLNIEARIGELLPKPEIAIKGTVETSTGRMRYQRPEGITSKRADAARAIKSNPAAVAAIIKEARENEDIPTKTAVLKKIKADKEKILREKYEKETSEKAGRVQRTNSKEAVAYLNILQRFTLALPVQPPADWTEEAFAEATALANIIRKRLEVFHA